MLGDFDLDAYTETSYQYISVSLLLVYIIVVTILLLNLLVAMMGDTYGNIIEGATQVWYETNNLSLCCFCSS
jgi:transient receptor potential cation channel subfamily V member 6